MKRLTGILLSSAMALSLTACSGSAPGETTAPAAETTTAAQTEAAATEAETEAAGIPDGTYEGEGTGKGGTIKIELTIKDSEIADIKVLEHQETPGYADAMDKLRETMIATNQIDVDMVSGATLSSTGFLEAVNNAFEKTGAASDLLTAKAAAVSDEKADHYDADVIVVGAGGAGLSAAITAAEDGAKVTPALSPRDVPHSSP